MGIGPLELSGGISRVQDYANMRSSEEARPIADQAVFADRLQKEVHDKSETVKRGDDTENNAKRFDAKEKGATEYGGDGGQKRKEHKPVHTDGNVIEKSSHASFDVRI